MNNEMLCLPLCGASGPQGQYIHDPKCPFVSKMPEIYLSNRVNKDGGGLRFNKGKSPIHLVPPSAILAIASVLGYGATKYAPRNWERGMKWSVPYSSMMRHLLAWQGGEENDPESGLPHLHHVICNAAMLVEFNNTYKEGDDRPRNVNDIKTT